MNSEKYILPGWSPIDHSQLNIDKVMNSLRIQIKSRIYECGFKNIEHFCIESGIPKSTMTRFFNGEREPKLSTILKICYALGWENIPL